jgi:hypothetical protein
VVTIEINGRLVSLRAGSVGAAQVAAVAAMGGGALRVWIDGHQIGGPIDEIDVVDEIDEIDEA